MDMNNIIFPSPSFNYLTITSYENDLIFIPKDINAPMINSPKDKFIPCLLLLDNSQDISNNFLLMFHGNAEDIFGAWTIADKIRQKLCINVMVIEYPGYSIYEEEKSSDAVLEDSLYIFDYIKRHFENVNDENIFVLGRSIGTSPAIYLASQRKPAALFVISGFTSIRAVAENLAGAFKIFIKDRFNSVDYIKTVSCPVLFIHGQKDALIPCTETIKLKENCINCPFDAQFPDEMTHNDFDLEMDIINPIQQFIYKNCCSMDSNIKANIPEAISIIPDFIREKIKAKMNVNGVKN